jgi:hypothetical protein
MKELNIPVEERLIQTMGTFYKWDGSVSQNILVKSDVFLSVDRVAENKGGSFGGRYILHVFDMSG